MKKIISIILIVLWVLCLSACDDTVQKTSYDVDTTQNIDINGESSHQGADGNEISSTPNSSKADTSSKEYVSKSTSTISESTHTHDYSMATCTSPKICSCGATVGTELGHQFSSATCTIPQICNRCGTTNGNALGHNFSAANCIAPKTCSRCGETSGGELGHSYSGKSCSRCGMNNPYYNEPEWSLKLPDFPQNISYYSNPSTKCSTVKVTNITYVIEHVSNYTYIMVYFTGEKIYDYGGTEQKSECKIAWKVAAPDGTIVSRGTFTSPSVAVGEKFTRHETVLYENTENVPQGEYRLEISDVIYC